MKKGDDLRGRKNLLKLAFDQEIAKLKAERFNAQTERQNKIKARPAGLKPVQEISTSSTKENSKTVKNGPTRGLQSKNKKRENGSRVGDKKVQSKKEPKNRTELPIRRTQTKKVTSKREQDAVQQLRDQVRMLLQQRNDLETQVSWVWR